MQFFLACDRSDVVSHNISLSEMPQVYLKLSLIQFLRVHLEIEPAYVVGEAWHAQKVQLDELRCCVAWLHMSNLHDREKNFVDVLD